jgi:4-amino-4-deoxy-L-arabinose transferase-like glycosyltransferase
MTKRNRQKTFPIYAVLIVMVVGLALRLYGIEWGLPTPAHPNYSYHPDELPTLVWAHWLSKGAIIQQQFVYGGTLYFSILNSFVYFGEVLADLLPGINLWADSILFGRYAMTAIALITILLVYRIGKELYDERVGIAAAASLAIFPAHIVWAQCVRVDEIAAFFVALVFLFAVKILRGNKRDGMRYYIYSGIALGAAIATRFPLGIFGVALVVAHVVNKQHARFTLGATLLDRRLLVMCLCVAAAFCILSPHIFFYFDTFVEGIRFSLSYQAPAFPDAVGRGPVFLQYLWRILPQAVGYPLFVMALSGIVIAAYRRGRENVLVCSALPDGW